MQHLNLKAALQTNSLVAHLLTNSAFYPSGVGKCVPALAGKAKAGMVHSISVQIKLWDHSRTRAIPKHHRGAFMIGCYTNPRLRYLTKLQKIIQNYSNNSLTVTTYIQTNKQIFKRAAGSKQLDRISTNLWSQKPISNLCCKCRPLLIECDIKLGL